MSWWRCPDCGFRYASHPGRCERCGAERFEPYEPSLRERVLRPSVVITAVGLTFLAATIYLLYL